MCLLTRKMSHFKTVELFYHHDKFYREHMTTHVVVLVNTVNISVIRGCPQPIKREASQPKMSFEM